MATQDFQVRVFLVIQDTVEQGIPEQAVILVFLDIQVFLVLVALVDTPELVASVATPEVVLVDTQEAGLLVTQDTVARVDILVIAEFLATVVTLAQGLLATVDIRG